MKQYDLKYTISVPDDFDPIAFDDSMIDVIVDQFEGSIAGNIEPAPKTKWEAIKKLLSDLWFVIRWGI